MRKKLFYTLALSVACMTASAQRIPAADILDVQFQADGTAVDLSTMKNPVEKNGSGITVAYDDAFGRYVASFTNPWSKTCTGWYKVDYNDADSPIRAALADGHSLEMLLMGHYDGTILDAEAKCFSAMQGGGTGFLVSKISGARQNELTFLPNVSTDGKSKWNWCNSGVVPQSDIYYHVIGVWNKEENKANIYVNGELKKSIDVAGNFNFATGTCNWFCLGGDADPNGGGQGWTGDLVIARAYDKALDATEAGALWQAVAAQTERANSPAYQNRPKISLASGTYEGEQTITLTSKSYGTIYYTLDGSEPNDATGTLYTEPIAISSSATLKAIAYDDDDNPSEMTSAEYVFTTKKVFNYTKVTTMNQIAEGGAYVMGAMVDGTVKVAQPLDATKTYGYLQIIDASEKDGALQLASRDCDFTITLSQTGARITDIFGRYLQQKGTYNSFNVETDETAEGLDWGAQFNEDGTVTIINLNVNKYIQYSVGYGSYGSYATEQSNAVLPCLYRYEGFDFVPLEEPDPTPTYSTIAELQEAATTTNTEVKLTIKDWYVSGVNGNQFYLTDGNGLGIVGYQKGHGFNQGDCLSGTVLCNLVLYKNLGELTELTAANDGLVVTPGMEVPAVTTAPGQLTGANQGALVSLSGLYYSDGKLFDANGASVTPYNTFKISDMPDFTENAYYDITGVVVMFNNTVEIAPLAADKVSAVEETVTLSFAEGWSTFICPFNVTLPEGVEASVVISADANGVLALQSLGNSVAANTPVAIYAKEAVTATTVGTKMRGVTSTEGMLTGVYEDTPAPVGSYVLQNLNGQVAFYQVEDGKQPTVKSGKCYLMLDEPTASVKVLTFGDATGIECIQNVEAAVENEIFDLAGRRVRKAVKGIYIVNGKKVLK